MKEYQKSILPYLLIFLYTVFFFGCTSLDGLIRQGRLQEAEEYCNNQSSGNKQKCYNKLADAYLWKNNYDKALKYYAQTNNSQIIKDGYIKIAHAYMDGEFKDSKLKIDVNKAQYYLRKIYNDEKKILTYIAEYFEKKAYECKENAEKCKELMDMGITAYGSRGRSVNVKKLHQYRTVQTKSYFTEAITCFEKLDNKERADKLKKELELFTLS